MIFFTKKKTPKEFHKAVTELNSKDLHNKTDPIDYANNLSKYPVCYTRNSPSGGKDGFVFLLLFNRESEMLTEVGKLIINKNEIFEDKPIAPAFTDAGPRPFMDVQSASNLIDSAPSTKNKMYVDFPSKYYNETTGILDPQAAQAAAAQAPQALNKTEIALINQQLNGKKTRPLKKQNMGPDQEIYTQYMI